MGLMDFSSGTKTMTRYGGGGDELLSWHKNKWEREETKK
jgi:hypothetical protein